MRHSNSITFLCATLLAALTSGCIPYPHTVARSAEVTGRVVDAVTLAPINRAKVELTEAPHHAIYTDEKGQFDLKPTRNLFWGFLPGGAEWPRPKGYSMTVAKSGYFATNFLTDLVGTLDKGNIQLVPSK